MLVNRRILLQAIASKPILKCIARNTRRHFRVIFLVCAMKRKGQMAFANL